jgi:hypothetical protein
MSAKTFDYIYFDPDLKKWCICPEGDAWLRSIKSPIGSFSAVGTPRHGKSTLLNLIMGIKDGSCFATSNGGKSCTRGLRLVNKTLTKTNAEIGRYEVFALDSEGLGATDTGDNSKDIIIFMLAALLSDVLVFNVNSALEQKQLDQLGMVSELIKRMKFGGAGEFAEEGKKMVQAILPKLITVLRNWQLDETHKAPYIAAYLEDSLKAPPKATADKIEQLQAIQNAFPIRTAIAIPAPHIDEQLLARISEVSEHVLSTGFRTGYKAFEEQLDNYLQPRKAWGKLVTGEGYANLARGFVDAVNNDSNSFDMESQRTQFIRCQTEKDYNNVWETFQRFVITMRNQLRFSSSSSSSSSSLKQEDGSNTEMITTMTTTTVSRKRKINTEENISSIFAQDPDKFEEMLQKQSEVAMKSFYILCPPGSSDVADQAITKLRENIQNDLNQLKQANIDNIVLWMDWHAQKLQQEIEDAIQPEGATFDFDEDVAKKFKNYIAAMRKRMGTSCETETIWWSEKGMGIKWLKWSKTMLANRTQYLRNQITTLENSNRNNPAQALEIKSLSEEIERLKETEEQWKKDIESMKQKNEELQTVQYKLTAERDEAVAELDSISQRLQHQEQQFSENLKEATAQFTLAEAEVERLQQQVSGALVWSNECKELRQNNENLQQEMNQYQKDQEGKATEFLTQLEELQQAAQQTIEHNKNTHHAVQQELNQRLEESNEQIKTLQDENVNLTALYTKEQERVVDLRNELKKIEEQYKSYKMDMTAYQQQYNTKQEELTRLLDELNKRHIAQLMEVHVRESKSKDATTEQQIVSAKEKKVLELELATYKANMSTIEIQKKDLQKLVEELRETNRKVTMEACAAKTELNDITVVHGGMKEEFKRANIQISELNRTIGGLTVQLAVAQNRAMLTSSLENSVLPSKKPRLQ